MIMRGQIVFIALLACVRGAVGEDIAAFEFFEKQVRPILAARCHKCHGPEKQESDLRLDSAVSARRGGLYGAAVVPGKPDESLLISATSYRNEDLQMPPVGPLPADEVAVLRRWVEIGAPWPAEDDTNVAKPFDLSERKAGHWAWQPVRRLPVPVVHAEKWPRNEVDHFVLHRLEERGLKPAVDADRRTLIRRVYLDLVGLPPTPNEMEDFLADDSPAAFERVVDRLLSSPQFGERWARHWFDLVRYRRNVWTRAGLRHSACLAVSRLCDPRSQCRRAVRRVRDGTRCRRSCCNPPRLTLRVKDLTNPSSALVFGSCTSRRMHRPTSGSMRPIAWITRST